MPGKNGTTSSRWDMFRGLITFAEHTGISKILRECSSSEKVSPTCAHCLASEIALKPQKVATAVLSVCVLFLVSADSRSSAQEEHSCLPANAPHRDRGDPLSRSFSQLRDWARDCHGDAPWAADLIQVLGWLRVRCEGLYLNAGRETAAQLLRLRAPACFEHMSSHSLVDPLLAREHCVFYDAYGDETTAHIGTSWESYLAAWFYVQRTLSIESCPAVGGRCMSRDLGNVATDSFIVGGRQNLHANYDDVASLAHRYVEELRAADNAVVQELRRSEAMQAWAVSGRAYGAREEPPSETAQRLTVSISLLDSFLSIGLEFPNQCAEPGSPHEADSEWTSPQVRQLRRTLASAMREVYLRYTPPEYRRRRPEWMPN